MTDKVIHGVVKVTSERLFTVTIPFITQGAVINRDHAVSVIGLLRDAADKLEDDIYDERGEYRR